MTIERQLNSDLPEWTHAAAVQHRVRYLKILVNYANVSMINIIHLFITSRDPGLRLLQTRKVRKKEKKK